MEEEQLTPIIEELTKVLEGKASREDIEQQVSTFANVYRVEDPKRIRDSILKKYGMGPTNDTSFVTADNVQKKIGELLGNENRVDIVAKVVFVEKKTATIKGNMRHLLSGTLGDETGTAQFTVWDGENCELEQGAVYRFRNAYTKTWNSRIQINIGNNGSIMKETQEMDVTSTSQSGSSGPAAKMKIADLKGTEGNVDLEVRAMSAEKKTVNIKGENREIISGTIADETGSAQFTVWNAEGVNMMNGGCYAFKGAYTKIWNDQVQINIGNRGSVELLGREVQASETPAVQVKTATAPGIRKRISELTGSESNVDILVKILFAERRDVVIKGEERSIISGTLGDETGTASFTAWDADAVKMEKDSVYLISNAYTKIWNDRIQINLGNRCSVTKQDIDIATPERQQISYSASVAKVRDLKEGIGSVTVTGKILSVECRTINSRGEDKQVWSGLLADETGKIQFSAWNDFGLNEGDAVRVENAYIRAWKGIPQLNIGDRSAVDKVDDTFGDVSASAASKKTVGEIMATGGGLDMSVTGTVMDIRAGSGIIKRCPECKRSILSNECMTHGTVVPVPDLRMKAIVDDGTGAMSAIVNREVTEKLTGITLAQAEEYAADYGESSVAKLLGDRILMRNVTFRGNVMSDEYGPSMIVKDADPEDRDVAKEAESLLSEVEEAMM